MSKFLVCNHLFPNVQYETNIFVVKMIQIWDYYIWIIRFMCANWGQIDILGKIITGQNLRFSVRGPFMFEIQTYWIISVSIFEQYIFEIHRLCIESASTEISKCILSAFCLCSVILPIPVLVDNSPVLRVWHWCWTFCRCIPSVPGPAWKCPGANVI